MSLYNRIKGGDNIEKIPIWPAMATIWQLLEGEVDITTAMSRFNLSQDERTEFTTILVKLQADIAGGMSRYEVHHQFWNVLVCVEAGYYSESEFNTRVGL